jgi:hypothetical protein
MALQQPVGARPARAARRQTPEERAQECAAIQAKLKQEAAARRAAAAARDGKGSVRA